MAPSRSTRGQPLPSVASARTFTSFPGTSKRYICAAYAASPVCQICGIPVCQREPYAVTPARMRFHNKRIGIKAKLLGSLSLLQTAWPSAQTVEVACVPQHFQSARVLHLTQHIGHLMLQQRAASTERSTEGLDCIGSATIPQRKHGCVSVCNWRTFVQQIRSQLR